ncbi:MAG: M23 family metallopeptidase [Deltaproteobacteria bacterium]|nr:M23 family metallopeptidase [Deltaproteobacteria bacterium]HDM09848.1 M23 family metallopeptidase [Desulfobacteraceae bacterium]
MGKGKRFSFGLALIIILLVLGALAWFLVVIFEGEKPLAILEPSPYYISGPKEFHVKVADKKSGLKSLSIRVVQEGRKVIVLDRKFPYKGLLNKEGEHEFEKSFVLDPSVFDLGQGGIELILEARDYSRRNGGDGNLSVIQRKMVVDTIPPSIRPVSRMNYITVGGAGLIVYEASSDTVQSGVYVDDMFFPGFQAGEGYPATAHVCYFSVPYYVKKRPQLYLWGKDKAGNESKAGFYYRIRRRNFRRQTINITDRFLRKVLPYFSFYQFPPNLSDVEKFLIINRKLRKENAQAFYELRKKTSSEQLWEGPWLRLKNSATMARFGDHRTYYYKGKKIDEQTHLGVDLASLAHSKVQAANSGKVIFADRIGIYGLTIVLDHGQGLTSIYSHLSQILVNDGQTVSKGQVIGVTGQTGLAGGDHLHFGVMVNGVFVNPVEWWDGHWIRDNVVRKLKMLRSASTGAG